MIHATVVMPNLSPDNGLLLFTLTYVSQSIIVQQKVVCINVLEISKASETLVTGIQKNHTRKPELFAMKKFLTV